MRRILLSFILTKSLKNGRIKARRKLLITKNRVKSFLKKIIYYFLVFLARIRLKRLKNVKIIGITGSAGKTTTKDAIYKVLSRHYKVVASKKSYNTEFGLPLTILGAEAGFSSPILWMKSIFKALYGAFFSTRKIDFFALEMGVDKPGDMQTLTSVVKPDIAVFINVKPVHLDKGQFKNLDEIFEEKSFIVKNLKLGGTAILNFDDHYVSKLKDSRVRTIWYGIKEGAKLRATDIKMDANGISFNAHYGNLQAKFSIPVLGKHHISSILAAIACGLECGMYINEISQALKNFTLSPGRMNLIEGINGSLIIDSSYNASPESTMMALDVLNEIGEGKRKIFVFGNMNELGKNAEMYHGQIGECAARKIDIFITVGELARHAAREALKNSMNKENVRSFSNALEAANFVKTIIKEGDVILVKGSQNRVRLERLVREIMARPEMAGALLIRQEKIWQKIE